MFFWFLKTCITRSVYCRLFLQIISFFSSSVTTFRFFINWLFIKGIVSRDSRCMWLCVFVSSNIYKKALLFSWFEPSGLLVNRQNIFDIGYDLAKIFEILRKSAVCKIPRSQEKKLKKLLGVHRTAKSYCHFSSQISGLWFLLKGQSDTILLLVNTTIIDLRF